MNQASHNAPICKKHGCEQKWTNCKSIKAGGQWRCPACKRESQRRWRQANSEKHAANNRAWHQANTEKVAAKNRAWHQANTEKVAAKNRAWAQANPEEKAANSRAWQKANPEKAAANSRAWRQANPEKHVASSRAWRQANPEKVTALLHRHRARKRNATVPGQPVTAAVIAERFALFDGCAYCGADKKLTVDHVVALKNGGLHVASNLVGACGCCNSSKKDTPVEEWYRAQPFFSEERWSAIKRCTDLDCFHPCLWILGMEN